MYQSRIRQNKRRVKNKVLMEPEEGQEYAVVKDMLGNGRLRCFCEDGTEKIGRIRGSMRKYAGKVIIDRGDLILIAGRDFGQDDKVDVFHKYSHEDISALMKMRVLPEKIYKALTLQDESTYGKAGASDDYVVFMSEDEKEPSAKEDSDASMSGDDSDERSDAESEEIDIDAI